MYEEHMKSFQNLAFEVLVIGKFKSELEQILRKKSQIRLVANVEEMKDARLKVVKEVCKFIDKAIKMEKANAKKIHTKNMMLSFPPPIIKRKAKK